MANTNSRKWNKMSRNGDDPFDPLDPVKTFIPKGMAQKLREMAKEQRVPLSRLILIALDNEFESPMPFNRDFHLPKESFLDGAFQDEGQLLTAYMFNFTSGVDRTLLYLCRRDFGIPDRGVFLQTYRQLLKAEIIEECPPPPTSKFEYGQGHIFVRLKGLSRAELIKRRNELRERGKEDEIK